MNKQWRIITDRRHDGFYNMAKDEALFRFYHKYRIPTLRIYSWLNPCITLGYFQNIEQTINLKTCRDLGVQFVRRITGGAALLHANEITYSLVCDTADLDLSSSVKETYRKLNGFLLLFYKSFGLEADYFNTISLPVAERTSSCYDSTEPLDIVINKRKIGGHAQRRSKSIVFQQGTVPIALDWNLIRAAIKGNRRKSNSFIKATALSELVEEILLPEHIGERLRETFLSYFKLNCNEYTLTDEELRCMNKLLIEKYSTESWNFLRQEATQIPLAW